VSVVNIAAGQLGVELGELAIGLGVEEDLPGALELLLDGAELAEHQHAADTAVLACASGDRGGLLVRVGDCPASDGAQCALAGKTVGNSGVHGRVAGGGPHGDVPTAGFLNVGEVLPRLLSGDGDVDGHELPGGRELHIAG